MESTKKQEFINNFFKCVDEFCKGGVAGEMVELKDSKTASGSWSEIPLAKRIVSQDLDFVKEIGPVRAIPHTHIIIKISHRGLNVKMDYDGIKKWFSSKLGYSVHFFSKLWRDTNINLQQYIKKTVIEEY